MASLSVRSQLSKRSFTFEMLVVKPGCPLLNLASSSVLTEPIFLLGTDMEEGQDPGADSVNHAGDQLEG